MLNQWLNDLAQEEHEKTASAQFEEVLKDMDIPELRAFLNIGKEKTAQYPETVQQSVRPVDMEAARAERARGTRLGYGALGALGGGAVGALGGAALGSPGAAALGGVGGAVGGGYLGHRLSKGTAERGAASVPDETYQALSDTDVAERLYDSGRISRRELQSAYDAAAPALMAGKEDPRDAAEYDRMRAAGISASDMAPYAYADKTASQISKEAQAMFSAADQAGRALAHSIAKEAASDPEMEAAARRGGAIGTAIPSGLAGAGMGALLGGAAGGGRGAALGALAGGVGMGALGAGSGALAGHMRAKEIGGSYGPMAVGGLAGLTGADIAMKRLRDRREAEAAAEKTAASDPEMEAAARRGGAIGTAIPSAIGGAGMGALLGAAGGRRGAAIGALAGGLGMGALGAGSGALAGHMRAKGVGGSFGPAAVGGLAGLTGADIAMSRLKERRAAEEEAAAKTASFRGAIQKLATEGRLRTFAEKTAAMTPNDAAKVQAVSDAMKKTKGMSLQQRKQVMKGVGKAIPGGK